MMPLSMRLSESAGVPARNGAEVREELSSTVARMEDLQAQNKVKTATYRQLFAARVTLKEIDRRLASHGL